MRSSGAKAASFLLVTTAISCSSNPRSQSLPEASRIFSVDKEIRRCLRLHRNDRIWHFGLSFRCADLAGGKEPSGLIDDVDPRGVGPRVNQSLQTLLEERVLLESSLASAVKLLLSEFSASLQIGLLCTTRRQAGRVPSPRAAFSKRRGAAGARSAQASGARGLRSPNESTSLSSARGVQLAHQ